MAIAQNYTNKQVGLLDNTLPPRRYKPFPERIILAGNSDEEAIARSNCTVEKDYVHFKRGGFGWKVSQTGSVTSSVQIPMSKKISAGPICGIGAWLYLEEPSNITSLYIRLYNEGRITWNQSLNNSIYGFEFKKGWNLIRTSISLSKNTDVDPDIGTIDEIRALVAGEDDLSWTIGSIWVEKLPNPFILLIQDGGYADFYDYGYPELKDRNIPVTWALNPGVSAGRLSEDQIDMLATENNNSITTHHYAPQPDMTPQETLLDCIKAKRWLQNKGYTGWVFKGAWYRNDVEHAYVAKDLYMSYPMSGAHNTRHINTFPFRTRLEVARIGLDSSTPNDLDLWFEQLERTNGVMVCFIHRVIPSGQTGAGMPRENWEYFLQKLDNSSVQGTTFELLLKRSGIRPELNPHWIEDFFWVEQS